MGYLSQTFVRFLLCMVLLGVSPAYAGNYSQDLPWSHTATTESDCLPDKADAFHGGSEVLVNALNRCQAEIGVLDVNNDLWTFYSDPTLIFEDRLDPLSGVNWRKRESASKILQPDGFALAANGNLTRDGKYFYNNVKSLPSVTDWWSQNDQFEAGQFIVFSDDQGHLKYQIRRRSWRKSLGNVIMGPSESDSVLVATDGEGKAIRSDLQPIVLPKLSQRMVHVFTTTEDGQISEWIFDGISWTKGDLDITNAGAVPYAFISNAHKFHVTPTSAVKLETEFKTECPDGAFTDLTLGGCWECKESTRTVHPVDGAHACKPPRRWSSYESKKPATGIIKTVCSGNGYFLHRLSGTCYKCPSQYKRSTESISGNRACFQDYYIRAERKDDKGCPRGSFRNWFSNACWECPGGGDRTVRPAADLSKIKNACEQKNSTIFTLFYVSKAGRLVRKIRDVEGKWNTSENYPPEINNVPFRVVGTNDFLVVNKDGKIGRLIGKTFDAFEEQPGETLAGPGYGGISGGFIR